VAPFELSPAGDNWQMGIDFNKLNAALKKAVIGIKVLREQSYDFRSIISAMLLFQDGRVNMTAGLPVSTHAFLFDARLTFQQRSLDLIEKGTVGTILYSNTSYLICNRGFFN
jgi:hypothetical protein